MTCLCGNDLPSDADTCDACWTDAVVCDGPPREVAYEWWWL